MIKLPKITLLKEIKPKHFEVLYAPRCQHKNSGGLHGMDICNGKKIARCTRFARLDFGGVKVCQQHAGTMALNFIANHQSVDK